MRIHSYNTLYPEITPIVFSITLLNGDFSLIWQWTGLKETLTTPRKYNTFDFDHAVFVKFS